MKLEFSCQIFEKYSNVKFHENPSSGSRVVQYERTTEGQTDMTKLIVAFRNFASAPKQQFSLSVDNARLSIPRMPAIDTHAEYLMLIFPTATTVTRKHLNVTLHLNFVSRQFV